MSRQGQMLQAIGEDGIVYTWYRRPYNRRVPTQRQLELQQQLQPIQGEPPPTPQMLNPKQTQLSELGELILIRCFQSLPINDRFNMEHVSRLFQSASKRSWNIHKHVVVPPASLKKGTYSIDIRYLFRLLMKRCARYCLTLQINSMLKQDRIFRLLHLGYKVECLQLESLDQICGSELEEIGGRLPNLKILIIIKCKFHTNTINGFNLMLEQFKRLIVFAVGRCANFQSELEKLPRSLRILNLNLFDVVNSANAIGNIRRQAPNITMLTIECRSLDVVNQVQDFEHLKVLSLHYSPILDDVITPDLFPVNFSQQLKALELFVVSENFIAMRFRPEFFPQLEHIKFDIIENPTTNYNTILGQLVEFPALRSISLGVYTRKKKLICRAEYLNFVRRLYEKGRLEKIRSLYFYKSSNPNNIEEEEEYFRANEFIERFEQLKLNKIPPTSNSKKVVMLGNLFKGTKLEKGNEWIKCKENIRGSHVLRELFVNEFKEYENNNT
uniref:Uncharacterized protein n=1 Tax=Meloidogyne enterolobii TaxID=390850 RepID=A0A6V7XMW9_MELEN|nr:unnamed protein product [Meloidogyne enterolobii]